MDEGSARKRARSENDIADMEPAPVAAAMGAARPRVDPTPALSAAQQPAHSLARVMSDGGGESQLLTNANAAKGLAEFLRSLNPQRLEHVMPIESTGASFPLKCREGAIREALELIEVRYTRYLAGSYGDQKFHKIGVAAAGPGTGKTRLLWESLKELKTLYQHDYDIKTDEHKADLLVTLNNGVRVFATFGNGTNLVPPFNTSLYAVGGLAVRMLHSYFVPHMNFEEFVAKLGDFLSASRTDLLGGRLTLVVALKVIAYDVGLACDSQAGATTEQPTRFKSRPQLVIVAVDEYSNLDNDSLMAILSAFSGVTNNPVSNLRGGDILVQPILGGTTLDKAFQCIRESGLWSFRLAVPPLELPAVMDILSAPGRIPALQPPLLENAEFLELVADISGHPRSLDILVSLVHKLARSPHFTVSHLRTQLVNTLFTVYEHVLHGNERLPFLVKTAILGELASGADFAQDETKGIVLRIDIGHSQRRVKLHIPLLFLEVWKERWYHDIVFRCVQHLMPPGCPFLIHSEYGEQFEEEVFRFEALRLASTSGRAYPLVDYLRGAVGDLQPVTNWVIRVKETNPVIALQHRVPIAETAPSTYSNLLPIADNRRAPFTTPLRVAQKYDILDVLLALSAAGAPFDQFSSRLFDASDHQGLLCMQSKFSSGVGGVVTLADIQAEYEKVRRALLNIRLHRYFYRNSANPPSSIPFVLLLHTVKDLAADVKETTLPPRCFVVGRSQFPDYYGTIFGAHMAMFTNR